MLASEWSDDHEVEIICQKNPEPNSDRRFNIHPVFDASKPLSILKTALVVRELNPDVTVFNQSIGLWGQKKSSNLIGMALPLLTRKIAETPIFCLLHNVYEEMDVEQIERANKNPVMDLGIRIGTYLLLKGSDKVSVTLENYRDTLESEYNSKPKITHIPHGMPVNGFSYNTDKKDELNILAFGHWSPNKRLPLVLEAYQKTNKNINLKVCGTSHPDYPEYLEDIKESYPTSNVDFTGYIPEEKVDSIFAESDLVVLPYKAAVGTSGVLNLAMGNGTPVLATRTKALKRICDEEKAELLFCRDDPDSIAKKINQLQKEPSKMEKYARSNYQIAEERSFEKTSKLIEKELEEILESP